MATFITAAIALKSRVHTVTSSFSFWVEYVSMATTVECWVWLIEFITQTLLLKVIEFQCTCTVAHSCNKQRNNLAESPKKSDL